MVDIWILFMMFYPFLIVSLFAIKEVLKNKKNKVNEKNGNWVEQDERKIRIVAFLLSWGLPLLLSTFTLIYWIVGMQNYVSPDLQSVC